MQSDAMIHDANRIAGYFSGFPREEAINAILDHIRRFWERSMRDRLVDYSGRDGTGLDELVLEAVKRMEINC